MSDIDIREAWRTRLLKNHSNQLSMQDISNIATDIEAEAQALIAAGRVDAATTALDMANVGCFRHHDKDCKHCAAWDWTRAGAGTPADAQKALDDRLAAERTLFAQKAAALACDGCRNGWEYNAKSGRHKKPWPAAPAFAYTKCHAEGILALANPNALAEHDAALVADETLRTQIDDLMMKLNRSDIQRAKLEAENAELRALLLKHARENHLTAARDRTTECFEWTFEDCIAKECKEARTLLGEKT